MDYLLTLLQVQAGILRIRQNPVPSCATNCLSEAATSSGSVSAHLKPPLLTDETRLQTCSSSNVTCLCVDPMVSGYLRSCLGGSCPTNEVTQALDYFTAQCDAGSPFTGGASGSSSSGAVASSSVAPASTSDSGGPAEASSSESLVSSSSAPSTVSASLDGEASLTAPSSSSESSR